MAARQHHLCMVCVPALGPIESLTTAHAKAEKRAAHQQCRRSRDKLPKLCRCLTSAVMEAQWRRGVPADAMAMFVCVGVFTQHVDRAHRAEVRLDDQGCTLMRNCGGSVPGHCSTERARKALVAGPSRRGGCALATPVHRQWRHMRVALAQCSVTHNGCRGLWPRAPRPGSSPYLRYNDSSPLLSQASGEVRNAGVGVLAEALHRLAHLHSRVKHSETQVGNMCAKLDGQ